MCQHCNKHTKPNKHSKHCKSDPIVGAWVFGNNTESGVITYSADGTFQATTSQGLGIVSFPEITQQPVFLTAGGGIWEKIGCRRYKTSYVIVANYANPDEPSLPTQRQFLVKVNSEFVINLDHKFATDTKINILIYGPEDICLENPFPPLPLDDIPLCKLQLN